jgi:alkylation response protein AidB-like acyl-CoA dehydrogenase
MVVALKKKIVPAEAIENCIRHGSALKAAATDLAVRATSLCCDVVGLEGMRRSYGIEKCFRDAKVTQIYEGTNQTNRLDVFEREVGYEF